MSVTKLLSRINVSDDVITAAEDEDDAGVSKNLHDHTFGMSTHALTVLDTVWRSNTIRFLHRYYVGSIDPASSRFLCVDP